MLQAQRDYLSGCCGKSHFNLNIHSMQRQGVKKKWMKFRVFQFSIRITLAQLCFNQTLDRSLLLIKSPAGRKGGLSYLSHSATLHHYHWIYQCNMERMHLRRRLMAAAAKSPAGAQRRPCQTGTEFGCGARISGGSGARTVFQSWLRGTVIQEQQQYTC